jgi:hypothetical protein
VLYYFPTPYPDELFYSVITRYSKRTTELKDESILKSLFDQKIFSLGKSVPFGIKILWDKLKVFHFPSIHHLIKNHSHYQFYNNFRSPIHVSETFNEILYGRKEGNKINRRGINIPHSHNFFRYCPDCLNEDLVKYGETYWHSFFQLPTVFVCPRHKVLLEDSSVPLNVNGLVAADAINCSSKTLRIISKKTMYFLLKFAKESEILSSSDINFYFKGTALTLMQLRDKHYLDRYGILKKDKLVSNLIKFFGLDFLIKICVDPEDTVEKFILTNYKLSYLSYSEQLVIIIFLSNSINNFNSSGKYENISLDRDQYMICENNNCKKEVRLWFDIEMDNKRKRTLTTHGYNCECGLSFQAIFGDKDITEASKHYSFDRYKLARKVREEIIINSKTIQETARIFNITIIDVEIALHHTEYTPEKLDRELLDRNREKWEALLQQYPTKSYLELKYDLLTVYSWLYRNDREWLNHSVEKLKGNKVDISFVRERDYILKEHLRATLHRLFIFQYKGKQISKWFSSSYPTIEYLSSELCHFPETSRYIERINNIYKKYFQSRKSSLFFMDE